MISAEEPDKNETGFERMTRAVRALDRARAAGERYDEGKFLSDEETKSALRYADVFVRTLARELPIDPVAHLAAVGLNGAFRPVDPKDQYRGHYLFADGFPQDAVFLVHEQLRRALDAVQRKLAAAPRA